MRTSQKSWLIGVAQQEPAAITCPLTQDKETTKELNLRLPGYCTGCLTSTEGTCVAQHSRRALKQPAAGRGNTWKRKSPLDLHYLPSTSAYVHLLSNHVQKAVLRKQMVPYPVQKVV